MPHSVSESHVGGLTHARVCRGKATRFVLQSTTCINTLEATFNACMQHLKTCPDLAGTVMILLLQVLQDISHWSCRGIYFPAI